MSDTVQVKVLFFAKSRDLVGQRECFIDVPASLSSEELLKTLLQHFPSIQPISENIVLSLNEDYLDLDRDEIHLNRGDELAVIPPISGGIMNHIDITDEVLSVDRVTSLVTSPSCGAISVFMGTTRDNFDGKQVVKLEYEAYVTMAKKKMEEVCEQIRNRWSVENIAMVHRLGIVPVTESSIIIAVSSPHRRESLEAVSYAIDTLKATVPIWKKEIYEDETSDWKANKECAWAGPKPHS